MNSQSRVTNAIATMTVEKAKAQATINLLSLNFGRHHADILS
jgi:hypothetical protein